MPRATRTQRWLVALYFNTEGSNNRATGAHARQNNTSGDGNPAVGKCALANIMTGFGNIALAFTAGLNIMMANNGRQPKL